MTEQDQIRAEQQAHARIVEGAENVTSRRPTISRTFKPKSAGAPKGHEAFLKALESSGAIVEFEKANSGDKVIGKIKCSDKYTVSVQVPIAAGATEYVTRVLFKHDISEFSTITRSVATEVH